MYNKTKCDVYVYGQMNASQRVFGIGPRGNQIVLYETTIYRK